MKKSTKIGLAILIGFIVLGLLFATMMFMLFKAMLSKYEFTTEELRIQYANAEVYTQYEDENIKFQYPEEWYETYEIVSDGYSIAFGDSNNVFTAQQVAYYIVTEEENVIRKYDHFPYQFSVNKSNAGASVERWFKINGKTTYMLYDEIANERYELFYMIYLDDGNVLHTQIFTNDKETLLKIASSLEF